jgi:hypothetical protein
MTIVAHLLDVMYIVRCNGVFPRRHRWHTELIQRTRTQYTGSNLKSSDVLGGEPNWSMLIIETLAVLQKPGFLSGDDAFKVMHHISNRTCFSVPSVASMPAGGHSLWAQQ